MTQRHGVEVYDYRTQEEKAQPSVTVPAKSLGQVACDTYPHSDLWDTLPHSQQNDWRSVANAVLTEWHRRQQVQEVPAVAAIVRRWQQLSADDISTLAHKLAQTDASKANLFAEALWSEAMDAEHARLQADDAAMDDSERHARIWDKLAPFLQDDEDMAQLRVAQ